MRWLSAITDTTGGNDLIQQTKEGCECASVSCDLNRQAPKTIFGSHIRRLLRTRGGTVYWTCKRACDFFISLVMLIVLSPIFLLISVIVVLTSDGPAIYRHQRIGKNGQPINVLKFRTMVKNADEQICCFDAAQRREWEDNFKLENDPRITPVGRFLRKSSLDELPQFVNIIKGEMSLVGPRPVVTAELGKYGENKVKFLSVTPGLTGYWQAYARSDCDYGRRMQMELEYVDHANFLWDIQILMVTCKTVLQGKGAQ